MESAQKIWFDVILHPHRSLSERGFLLLMLFISLLSFVAGLAFYLMGAWPVVGFFGLDLVAIYWAFKLNYRAALLSETIRLVDNALIVTRNNPRTACQEWRFQPYWVRVLLEEVNEYEGHMVLTSHGRRLTVGDFLSFEEKARLAAALRQALSLQQREMTFAGHDQD
jgi:uncharacterized membrane protein